MSAYRVVRYRRDQDIIHGVTGSPGHKFTPLVALDGTVRLLKVTNDEVTKHCTDIETTTPKRAAKALNKIGRKLGITQEAKRFLKDVK